MTENSAFRNRSRTERDLGSAVLRSFPKRRIFRWYNSGTVPPGRDTKDPTLIASSQYKALTVTSRKNYYSKTAIPSL